MKLVYLWQIIKLARLPIALAVIPTFLVGTFFALLRGAIFDPVIFFVGFFILFVIEIAASFANDFFDYKADKYNKQFGFSGGSGVLLEYPELRPFAKWASISLIILAVLLAILLTWFFAFPTWTIGYILVAVFFCWFYTAPPLRLVYRGLGELPHFLAAIMFPGWGYLLLTKTLDLDLVVFAIPFGLLGLTVILNFEIPDREADIQGGKQNFIVRFGRARSFLLINCLYFFAACLFVVYSLTNILSLSINLWLPTLFFLLPFFISLPSALKRNPTKETAAPLAIRNAVAGFSAVLLTAIYCCILIFI
jgi:1,4-dihydroxy-2-naphthoate octaprenyltransferase